MRNQRHHGHRPGMRRLRVLRDLRDQPVQRRQVDRPAGPAGCPIADGMYRVLDAYCPGRLELLFAELRKPTTASRGYFHCRGSHQEQGLLRGEGTTFELAEAARPKDAHTEVRYDLERPDDIRRVPRCHPGPSRKNDGATSRDGWLSHGARVGLQRLVKYVREAHSARASTLMCAKRIIDELHCGTTHVSSWHAFR